VRPVNVADYREAARRRLPRVLFDYIDGGAYAEWTLRENIHALERLTLRQRVLRDVSKLNVQIELFGQSLAMPLILAPVGFAGMNARRGEVQAARAAKAAGLPFCLSTVGLCSIEEVAGAVAPPWFQLYMIRDRGFMDELLAVARAAACPVLFFTVDLPTPGMRYRDQRNAMIATTWAQRARQALDGLTHPGWLWDVQVRGGPHGLGNLASATKGLNSLSKYWAWVGGNFDPTVTWKDIAWVRERWPGPLVIKGILDPEDAREAVASGADGIVVSNHGGRQLDGAPASITALPAIAQAVRGELSILMDGGIRSGLDVLKALALGADACLIGRAWAWALGARGEAGVVHVLSLMRQELRLAMSMTGCLNVADAGPGLLAGVGPSPAAGLS
jgi:L-lactate dehydrogenase (cytochrome)